MVYCVIPTMTRKPHSFIINKDLLAFATQWAFYGEIHMPFLTNNPAPNTWVSINGTVRAETQRQQVLVDSLPFKISLALYLAAKNQDFHTAGARLIELNRVMQKAYDIDMSEPHGALLFMR